MNLPCSPDRDDNARYFFCCCHLLFTQWGGRMSATEVRRPKQEWNETSILKCWGTFINLEKKTEELLKYNKKKKKESNRNCSRARPIKLLQQQQQPLSNRYFYCTVTPVWWDTSSQRHSHKTHTSWKACVWVCCFSPTSNTATVNYQDTTSWRWQQHCVTHDSVERHCGFMTAEELKESNKIQGRLLGQGGLTPLNFQCSEVFHTPQAKAHTQSHTDLHTYRLAKTLASLL